MKPKSAETRRFDEELGRRLTHIRKKRRMQAKELAAAAGISPGALYFYEIGGVSCPVSVLSRLAEALNVPVSFLMP